VKHSREILQVEERQVGVLRTEIKSSDPVISGRVMSKDAIFSSGLIVVAHRLTHPRQTISHRNDLLFVEYDEL